MIELPEVDDDDDTSDVTPPATHHRSQAPAIKVTALDDNGREKGEILNAAELAEVRAFLTIVRREKASLDLEQLAQDQPHIHQIVEGKKASLWIWSTVGALAKWGAIVIGFVVAWKTLIAGGQKP